MKKAMFPSFAGILLLAGVAFSEASEEHVVAKERVTAKEHVSTEERVTTSYGYVLGAPGVGLSFCDCGNTSTVMLGGGGEGLVKGGFGLGVDGGYLFSPSYGAQYGIGLVSPSALYQFKKRGKTNPFVLGGYTLAFRGGVANLVHFGGGVNHWLSQRWGLRLEVRYLMSPQYPQEAGVLQFRVGALIR